ncbi:hypothetical protein [Proteus phage RP7]|nr:hypothetical protein [Proteus phage RP7]
MYLVKIIDSVQMGYVADGNWIDAGIGKVDLLYVLKCIHKEYPMLFTPRVSKTLTESMFVADGILANMLVEMILTPGFRVINSLIFACTGHILAYDETSIDFSLRNIVECDSSEVLKDENLLNIVGRGLLAGLTNEDCPAMRRFKNEVLLNALDYVSETYGEDSDLYKEMVGICISSANSSAFHVELKDSTLDEILGFAIDNGLIGTLRVVRR